MVAIWNGSEFDEHASTTTSGMNPVGVVLDKTNFCSEMGGQQPDHGHLAVHRAGRGDDEGGAGEFRVEDVQSYAGYVLHIGRVSKREIKVGDSVTLTLDHHRRGAIASNHTATHLLNLGLRAALGDGVDQKGSLVAADRLRFDFSHAKPVAGDELAKIEHVVSDAIAPRPDGAHGDHQARQR